MHDAQALDGLNARFGVPDLVGFERGTGGLVCIRVTAPAATIYLHGAHVTDHIDKADGMKRKTLAPSPFRPDGETDRVFPEARRRAP